MSIRKRKGKKGDTYQVYFPYENELGVTCTYRKGGFKTKKEAEKHETLLKAQILKDGYLKVECKLTLNEVAKEYFELAKAKGLARETLQTRKILFDTHIKNTIGKYEIVKIKYPTLQKLFNSTNLSKSSQSVLKSILNLIFKYACKCCYIENNPVTYVELVGAETEPVKKTVTENEFNQIIQSLKNKRSHDIFKIESVIVAFYIGYYTGLRITEVLALKKSDFDMTNNTISINKRLNDFALKISNLEATDKLKTKSSKAIIPLAEPLKKILIEWFERNPYDHVICNSEGRYISSNYVRQLKPYIKKTTGIDFHFHMLRHTFISNLANKGVSPQVTKELARHSNIDTTMNVYTHINEEAQRQAINHVFNNESVKKVSNSISLTN